MTARRLFLSAVLLPITLVGGPWALRVGRDGALPPGALARVGASHWCPPDGVGALAFSPDGKKLASGGGGTVRLWDVATGQEVGRFDLKDDHGVRSIRFAAGGRRLLACTKRVACLFDVASGKAVARVEAGPPDKTYLLKVSIKLSADGNTLLTVAQPLPDAVEVTLWDAPTGRPVRRLSLPPAAAEVTLSAGGLLAWMSDQHTVQLVDARTGEACGRLVGATSWTSRLRFSPDGKRLAALKDRECVVWEVATGKATRWASPGRYPERGVFFSADGSTLATTDGGAVRLWDIRRGALRRTVEVDFYIVEFYHDIDSDVVAFSPDGKCLAVASAQSGIRLWDTATGKEVGGHQGKWAPLGEVHFVGDGTQLLVQSKQGVAALWGLQRGKYPLHFIGNHPGTFPGAGGEGLTLPSMKGRGRVKLPVGIDVRRTYESHLAAAARTGNTLALLQHWDERQHRLPSFSSRLLLADAATGAVREELPRLATEWEGHPDGRALRFSPDGRMLAATVYAFPPWGGDPRGAVWLWDTLTGRPLRQFPPNTGKGQHLFAFSPDSGMLLTASGPPPDFRPRPQRLAGEAAAWDLATGKKLLSLPALGAQTTALALSPDGRLLALGCDDGAVYLVDLLTAKQAARFAGHRGRVNGLDFSPDGRRLASAGEDATALVWDLAAVTARLRRPAPLAEAQVQALWVTLADGDALQANRAAWALALSPSNAVPFIRKRLPPVPHPDPRRLRRLLKDLGDEEYEVREAATAALAGLAELAEPALREALKAEDLEVRRRVERLLRRLERQPRLLPARERRALLALEHAGAPEARRLLQELAGGAAGALLTREAGAALGRLDRRAPPSR